MRASQALLVEGSLTLQGGRLRQIPVITLPGSPVSVLAGGGNGRLDQVTLQGEVSVVDAGSPVVLDVAGGLTLVGGRLSLTSTSNEVQLSFVGNQQVLGSGEIELASGAAQSRIVTGGATLTLGADVLVHGAGSVGAAPATSSPAGQDRRRRGAQALVIDGIGWSSSGELRP